MCALNALKAPFNFSPDRWMTEEEIFTEAWKHPRWKHASSSLERTEELRAELPDILQGLQITSVLDCGCGEFIWQRAIDFAKLNIDYIGADIVEPLITNLQETIQEPNVHFQVMNVLTDPPETTDLWLVRDLLPTLSFAQGQQFLKKFVESQTPYLAVTSITTDHENQDALPGSFRWLDMKKAPFSLPEPWDRVPDGQQWNKKKELFVYKRDQIMEALVLHSQPSTVEVVPQNTMHGIRDNKNAHLVSNVPLRQMNIRDHMGLGMPYRG